MKTKWFCLAAVMVSLRLFGAPLETSAASSALTRRTNSLKWDAESKNYTAKLVEAEAAFTFVATNVSDVAVSINSAQAICGGTLAKLPPPRRRSSRPAPMSPSACP